MNSIHPQPLIVVKDVEASSRWYRNLLGCESGQGRSEYERLTLDGVVILQLHSRPPDHTSGSEYPNNRGSQGVILWFELAEFDAAVRRAHIMQAEILTPVYENLDTERKQCWLQDPDGYAVVLAGLDGDS